MAADFTQDAVLLFLQRCGGSVKNTELLAHFLPHLRDNPGNVGNRDRFKSFVNSVATVSKIDGVSTVTLRKQYRGAGSGRDSAEPGPFGSGSSPAVSLAPPSHAERNPALPAAGIVVQSGTRLKYREDPSPEPVQVGNRIPELSEIPYQSRTEEQNRLGSAPAVPAVRHQDYITEPITWQEMPQESFVPAPTRRQEAPHQDHFPEPIRGQDFEPVGGHVVNHQDYTPRPAGRHEVPQQDLPHMPSRRVDKPHQRTGPEPVRRHIVGRQDHAPDPGERWDPPNQGTVSEPNKGRIVSRQDHAPDPIRGQKTSHQKRITEPFRGHVGNRQDHFLGPTREQQVLHQSPIPAPNRRRNVPHQDPRGYMINRVPEPIRGQNVFYQDPSRDPLRGWEVSAHHPTSQPPRGQQSFYQVPQNPEHLRGWEIPYQDPIPVYLSGQQIPQNLEPLRGQQIPYQAPQNPEPLRQQRIPYQAPQNPEPLRGQWIPYQVTQIPEHQRGQEISYEDLDPEAFRRQNVYYQDPIPEYLSGHQIPQNIELRRGQQVPQNLEPLNVQRVPQQVLQNPEPLRVQQVPQQIPEHLRGQEIPYEDAVPEAQNIFYQHPIPEYLSGHQVPQNPDLLRGQQMSYDPVPEPIRGQKIYFPDSNPELQRGQKIPYQDPIPEYLSGQQMPQNPERLWTADPPEPEKNLEPLRRQQVHQNLEPPNGQEVPQNPEPLKGQQISQNLEPPQRQQVPQNLELLKGQQISQSPELRRVHQNNPELLQGQQIPQSQKPLKGQQVPKNLELLHRHQVPQGLKPPKGQQVPQNLEPHKGQQISQSPELHRVHQKNLEPPKEKQIPQNLEPLKGQQVSKSPERRGGQKISFQDPIPESPKGQQSPPQDPEPVGGLEPAPQLDQAPPRRSKLRQSYRSAVSQDDDDKEKEDVQIRRGSAGGPWPLNAPLSDVVRATSASSPCITESPAPPASSSGKKVPQIYIQNSDLEVLVSRSHSESESRPEPGPVPVESVRRSLPLEAEFNTERHHDKRAARTSEPIRPDQNQRLSSSQSNIFDPPSDVRSSVSDWPPSGSSRTFRADEPAVSLTSQEVLQESNRTKPEPPARRSNLRQSYRSAVSQDDDDKEKEDVQIRRGSAGGPWPLNAPLSDVVRATSASSPCITESPAPPASSSGKKVPQIYIQNSDLEVLASLSHSESESRPEPGPVPVESVRRSLPLEAEFNTERHHDKRAARTSEPIRPDQNQRLSSSQSNIFDPPSDVRSSVSDWPPSGSSRTFRADEPAVSSTSQEVLQESNRTKPEPPARRSNLKMSFHHSMGDLCDDMPPRKLPLYLSSDHLDNQQEASRGSSLNQSTDELYNDMKSSNSSIDSPRVKVRSAAARRMSSRLRNRNCRSLGTDLDQEEADGGLEDARLERLHRISSSLSLPHHLSSSSLSSCTTPPRCPSPIASQGGRKEARKSLNSYNNAKSPVPLEAQEHHWMVKAAAGAWPEIYALFRTDSSLLNRQDFISGFTVLHWMAKHGDHRVINTLWYGVEQKGLSFDVNAKSTAGQTPLHIAAIHGHKAIIQLLVKKFGADVKLRDMAGKKAWQYLRDKAPDILVLLAAPPKAALTGGAENADPDWKQQSKQQRRLRHHLSSASPGQRPQTLAGMVKVSRSSSIAALLKHKSLHRF